MEASEKQVFLLPFREREDREAVKNGASGEESVAQNTDGVSRHGKWSFEMEGLGSRGGGAIVLS